MPGTGCKMHAGMQLLGQVSPAPRLMALSSKKLQEISTVIHSSLVTKILHVPSSFPPPPQSPGRPPSSGLNEVSRMSWTHFGGWGKNIPGRGRNKSERPRKELGHGSHIHWDLPGACSSVFSSRPWASRWGFILPPSSVSVASGFCTFPVLGFSADAVFTLSHCLKKAEREDGCYESCPVPSA